MHTVSRGGLSLPTTTFNWSIQHDIPHDIPSACAGTGRAVGVTRPVVLEATYNGGYAGHPMDTHARIGFSAQGVLKRSEFGISYGIPEPGTSMGVGDEVSVILGWNFLVRR